jgi:hypothetical protein
MVRQTVECGDELNISDKPHQWPQHRSYPGER